jgi:beta-lactamase class A|tara:strand:+ start:227 stop:475 length:249 start_codon:yes stop_codon:yes gene_type:complete
MRGRYSDIARTGSTSSSSSTPAFSAGESEPKSTETEKSKPAKSFLDKFVSDYEKDENRPGGMAGLAYLAFKKKQSEENNESF